MALSSFKKFSDLNKSRRIFEDATPEADVDKQNQDMPKANLPENITTGQEEQPQQQTNVGGTENGPVKFFSKLFESREMAHIYHLQVKGDQGSYAAHMALGSFYEGVIDLIDELVEVYQGQYDIVEGYETIDTNETRSKDKIEYFKDLADFIKTERKCISQEDTHLHNIIDEIVALTYKTLYKLRFNK